MIIYTCPKCGGAIYHNYISSIDIWACRDCDWQYVEKDGVEYRLFKPIQTKFDFDEDWIIEDE